MLINRKTCIRLAMLFSFIFIAGCGFGPPPIGEVRGKVLFNGKPLGNVRVEFYPEKETGERYLISRATTNEDGTFQLMCDDDRSGAVIGWHKVVVKPIRQDPGINPRDAAAKASGAPPRPKLNLAPYHQQETTRERREVVAGENTFDLNLTF
jgi:hypothetical protein